MTWAFTLQAIWRLFLAMLMGGLIGLEREIINRPAGLRTHTLVCMGSALTMITSEYIFSKYHTTVNLDPTRLSAQVISGIGFLGAGTILKDGQRIRGLTTAASLWVVACIGLTVGAGFYSGAIAASIMSYVILIFLKRMETFFERQAGNAELAMSIMNVPGQIARVSDVMGRFRVQIRDIKIESSDKGWINTVFYVSLPSTLKKSVLIAELQILDGVVIHTDD